MKIGDMQIDPDEGGPTYEVTLTVTIDDDAMQDAISETLPEDYVTYTQIVEGILGYYLRHFPDGHITIDNFREA